MAETAKKVVQKTILFPVEDQPAKLVVTEDDIERIIQQAVKSATATKKARRPRRTDSLYLKDGRRKPTPADPIKSKEDFKKIVDYLGSNGSEEIALRNKTMFILGCSIGVRCGDLLKLKTADVYYENAHVKDHVELIEQKTGKRNVCKISHMAKEALREYYQAISFRIDRDTLLFQSKKGGQLNVRSVSNLLKKAGKACGLDIELSTHSMRKTYAMAALQSAEGTVDGANILNILQTKFNHSDQRITMRYIKMDQEKLDKVAENVSDWFEGE